MEILLDQYIGGGGWELKEMPIPPLSFPHGESSAVGFAEVSNSEDHRTREE